MREVNPYLIRMEQVNVARTRWQESEWMLNLLRSLSSDEPKQLTDNEVLLWSKART